MNRRSLLLALCSALVLSGPATASAATPRAFDDDFDAALAVSGDTQWLIVGGVDGTGEAQTYGIEVYERVGAGKWDALPALPGKRFNSNHALHVVVQGRANPYPCVFYPVDAGPRLECLRGGEWKSAIGAEFTRAEVLDLSAPTPDSLALISYEHVKRQGHTRVLTSVSTTGSDGLWNRVGKPLEGILLAQFEHSDTTDALRIGVERMKRQAATRYIAAVSNGRWEAVTPLDRTREGPFVGGPIRVGGASYFPFTDSGVAPFQFGVLTWTFGATTWLKVGAGPLSAPKAAGQGGVAIVDGAPWAVWQEDIERPHIFDSAIRIADLSGPTVTPVTLWSGERISPGPVDLVDVPGPTAYALYMRGTPQQTLQVTVSEIAP